MDKTEMELNVEEWIKKIEDSIDILDKDTSTVVSANTAIAITKSEPKCECGADTAKTPFHSTWCPKYKPNNL